MYYFIHAMFTRRRIDYSALMSILPRVKFRFYIEYIEYILA